MTSQKRSFSFIGELQKIKSMFTKIANSDIFVWIAGHLKKSEKYLFQQAKCTYNPYIAKWKGEDGWVSVEEWIEVNGNNK